MLRTNAVMFLDCTALLCFLLGLPHPFLSLFRELFAQRLYLSSHDPVETT